MTLRYLAKASGLLAVSCVPATVAAVGVGGGAFVYQMTRHPETIEFEKDGAGATTTNPKLPEHVLSLASSVFTVTACISYAALVRRCGMQAPRSFQWATSRLRPQQPMSNARAVGVVAAYSAAAYATSAAQDWVGTHYFHKLKTKEDPEITRLIREGGALGFFAVCIEAPIVEEGLFRFFLFRNMVWARSLSSANATGKQAAVWLAPMAASSTLFGAAHYSEDGQKVVATTIWGAICCGVYISTGRLWAPMLFHAVNNLACYVAVRFFPDDDDDKHVE